MDQIREQLNFVVTNYHNNNGKEVIEIGQRLLAQIDSKEQCIERLYVLYYLCEIVSHLAQTVSKNEAQLFLKTLFPTENLSQKQANLMSQLISLALNVRNKEMLTCSAHYLLTCDRISLNNLTSNTLYQSLSSDSPSFCSAIISKGYFNSINKQLLTHWLNSLATSNNTDWNLTLNSSIRFSLLDGQTDSQLHLAILTIINLKRCQPLSNHFLIDISTVISQKTNNNQLVDRLSQILIVANSAGMCSLSNQFKNILQSKFPNNILIKGLCQVNK